MKVYPENREARNVVTPAEDSLPGEVELKQTVEATRHKQAKGSTLKDDANAGLTVAMNEIPDGMACGLLAGVSPIMGLFAIRLRVPLQADYSTAPN